MFLVVAGNLEAKKIDIFFVTPQVLWHSVWKKIHKMLIQVFETNPRLQFFSNLSPLLWIFQRWVSITQSNQEQLLIFPHRQNGFLVRSQCVIDLVFFNEFQRFSRIFYNNFFGVCQSQWINGCGITDTQRKFKKY